ncbi:hypothetical protein L1276_004231 [Flavobacterium sp. HSC-32F16]|uniref:hypothetical protein n=1 Tax=Flavobacterium sp. HSC-32F16 TaxID=2910964 RepID=UPI0020A3E1DB|nr:hypothetical protein [Flavobacterium sp. HSC-32F16]MCP2029052.1 hypothetical protein [Flavobacterium sp. HSC-32F16]
MINPDHNFRWHKVKNGLLHFAIVNLHIQKNETGNEIIEDYSGYKYSSDLMDVRHEGFNTWKTGLRNGLEFALSHSSDFWTIKINGFCASYMDTNATILGYTGVLAFIKETNIVISNLEEVENFVFMSWNDGMINKIPNFNELTFTSDV